MLSNVDSKSSFFAYSNIQKLLYFELSPPQKDTLGIEVAGVVKTYTSSCGHCIELSRQLCEVLYRHAHL